MLRDMKIFQHSKPVEEVKTYNYEPSDGVNTRVSVNKSLGYIEFGALDSFPNFLLDVVSSSHTASSCMDTLNKFIKGSGFEQESISKIKVNTDKTFSQFHNGVSQDEGYFEGFYINVRYNPLGKANYFEKLDYSSCRLGIPDPETSRIHHVYYNPYFGTGDYKEEETIIYPIYNEATVINEMQEVVEFNNSLTDDEEDKKRKYRGQVLFVKEQSPHNKFYPIPYYWSGYRYFEVERKVGDFHNSNLDNNFFLGGLLKIVGDPDEAYSTATNKDGEEYITKTMGEAFDEKMSSMFSGSNKGGRTLVLWSEVKDQFPEMEAFPTNANDTLFITLQNLVTDNIPIAYNVKLEEVYNMLFSNSIWADQVDPVEIIPFNFTLKDPLSIEEVIEEKNITDETIIPE